MKSHRYLRRMIAGGLMIKVWMLALFCVSLPLQAEEFTHIKLNPQFQEFLTAPKKVTGFMNTKSAVDAQGAAVVEKFRSAIFGTTASPGLKSDWTSPFPSDGEESPLYQEIRSHLEGAHQDIGRREAGQIDLINRQFNLGSQNFSGFSWQKPFGVIHVYADRQVTPNLFGDNWLIQDTFVFDIEAATFLERLNDAGLLNMSAVEIGAFAGITFKRVYTYYHYAASYQQGLTANFSKLFLPFVRFNQSGVENMENEEIMKREDQWTVRAGGLITSPAYYGFSFSAGVLGELAYHQTTTAQSTFTQEQDKQRFRLSVIGKKSAQAGATMSLQLDFFKLIKFSLLSYDLNYEYAKAIEYNLGFTNPQWEQVKSDPTRSGEMRKILKGFSKVQELEPYIVRLDESTSTSMQQRGSVLLWGKFKKSKTERVRVIKDQMVKVFFKSYAQNVKIVQNFFSRIFSAVVYRILKLPIGTSNAAMSSRQITMEYEATHPQAIDPKIVRIESSNQFSFVLTQSYEAARTDRWLDKRYKNDVVWFVDKFTTLSKDFKTIIRNEQLKGPLRVESNLRVEKAGFDYLLKADENAVWGKVAKVCGSKQANEWANQAARQELLEELNRGADACTELLGLKFKAFKSDYTANALMPSLKKFKDFMGEYYKKAQNLEALSDLFGPENTFINGRLTATTSEGNSFVTSFSAGQFRGLGVIDNFKRSTGSRMPASILSE